MNTLNYIGCKNKLSEWILETLSHHVDNLSEKTIADLFMGTGIVSYKLSQRAARVLANDLEYYSFVIGQAILCCNLTDSLLARIHTLNGLDGIDGLIYQHYSPHAECERMFFTNENARKADAIRSTIEEWKGQIAIEEYYFLIASLLVSLDKVANTTSVYGAYLKAFKKSAKQSIRLVPIHQDRERGDNRVTCGFAEQVDFYSETVDITYLDPPYNQRSYSANYFVLNYVARYNPTDVPRGKTGIIGENRSAFCSRPKIREAFVTLLDRIRSPLIVLSYNNEGLLSREQLIEILRERGEVTLYRNRYPKFKAQQNVEETHVEEYLWVVDTQGERGRLNEL